MKKFVKIKSHTFPFLNLEFGILYFFAFFLNACVKDIPKPDSKITPNATHKGMIILNEGSYANNNAEISFLDFENNTICNSIFNTANNKSLGDVAQDIILVNGNYYITINNSNKIVVVDAMRFNEVKTITNIPNPRYFLKINDSVLYVSSLYSNSIFVLNTNQNEIINTIQLDFANTEKMILLNGKVYASNWNTSCNFIYLINPLTHLIEDKINISGYAAHQIEIDKNGMLWVLSGNKYQNTNSYFTVINPTTKQIIKSFTFTKEQDPFRLVFNKTRDSLYFLQVNYQGQNVNNGLYKMSIENTMLPSQPFIPAQTNSYFWAIGLDTFYNQIYLSDPKGFNQSSAVMKYDLQGNFIQSYKAGIGANTFLFP
jgi:DNA-binding beta-propeller fold protein YncE